MTPVELYPSPWVKDTRAVAYFGPISSEVFLPNGEVKNRGVDWVEAELRLLAMFKEKAEELGANAVLGVEVALDPFYKDRETNREGLRLSIVGTAAVLEPLFE